MDGLLSLPPILHAAFLGGFFLSAFFLRAFSHLLSLVSFFLGALFFYAFIFLASVPLLRIVLDLRHGCKDIACRFVAPPSYRFLSTLLQPSCRSLPLFIALSCY